MKITLFVPCFIDQLLPQAAISTVKLLERLGHSIDYPENQTCCGQPAFNAGSWDEARQVALHFLDTFAHADCVVSPSGSCTTMIRRFYPELFPPSHPASDQVHSLASRTYELTEFLVRKLGLEDVGARFDGRVAWHDGCHALRELGIREEPRKLLRSVKGLELVELNDNQSCCGFGGLFSVKLPAISTGMDEAKVKAVQAAQVDVLTSTDSSCLMQIGGLLQKQKSPIRTLHIAEILAST